MATHITPSANVTKGEILPATELSYGPRDFVDYSGCRQVQAEGTPANGDNGGITWSPLPVTKYRINFYIGAERAFRYWEVDTEAHRDAELALIETQLTT
jgi:hypothetical protein